MEKDEKINGIVSSFREVNKYFHKQMWQHANELGVTLVQLQIMKIISEETDMSLLDLSGKMHINKSTVSSTVDRLVKAEYIRRERSREDRRAIVLNVTELGKEKLTEGYALFYKRLERLDEISEEEAKNLFRLHQLVKEKININGDEEN
ncbi:MarR family winged helix-turn-helix transcriptional regulator [Lentibacillus sediminis]|uniref:MarR family winged helix-turn-helix transcriptional regulator n=1 Tax=Lentibacillus sediminis TaxID=1940529 RepID=UPI000C1BBF39|nr:MarR family transcriptional regulator [Lentibacillus sediminis]